MQGCNPNGDEGLVSDCGESPSGAGSIADPVAHAYEAAWVPANTSTRLIELGRFFIAETLFSLDLVLLTNQQ